MLKGNNLNFKSGFSGEYITIGKTENVFNEFKADYILNELNKKPFGIIGNHNRYILSIQAVGFKILNNKIFDNEIINLLKEIKTKIKDIDLNFCLSFNKVGNVGLIDLNLTTSNIKNAEILGKFFKQNKVLDTKRNRTITIK